MRMRRFAKRMLKLAGLAGWARNVRDRCFLRKYRGRTRHTNCYRGVGVHFAAKEHRTERWFYPRFENGRVHESKVMDLIMRDLSVEGCIAGMGVNAGYFTCLAGRLGWIRCFWKLRMSRVWKLLERLMLEGLAMERRACPKPSGG